MIGNLREVDIKRLRIFMTIVESGGFAQAQNELGLSASTISVRMAELEHSLGLRLCNRGRSGFSMTPEGSEVYRACQSLVLSHDKFVQSIGAVKGEISGELRLGVIDNVIFDPGLPISQVLADFAARDLLIVFTADFDVDTGHSLTRRAHALVTFHRVVIGRQHGPRAAGLGHAVNLQKPRTRHGRHGDGGRGAVIATYPFAHSLQWFQPLTLAS